MKQLKRQLYPKKNIKGKNKKKKDRNAPKKIDIKGKKKVIEENKKDDEHYDINKEIGLFFIENDNILINGNSLKNVDDNSDDSEESSNENLDLIKQDFLDTDKTSDTFDISGKIINKSYNYYIDDNGCLNNSNNPFIIEKNKLEKKLMSIMEMQIN